MASCHRGYPVSGISMTGGEKSWRPERSQAAKRPLRRVAFCLNLVPGSLSKCESISLIYIDTNQTKLDLYPQKYPQPFHAGACFAIQKDLLLVGHLFGFRPMMSPMFGRSPCWYPFSLPLRSLITMRWGTFSPLPSCIFWRLSDF